MTIVIHQNKYKINYKYTYNERFVATKEHKDQNEFAFKSKYITEKKIPKPVRRSVNEI